MKKEKIFQKISSKCNYVNPSLVAEVYFALWKFVLEQLQLKGEINLPDWGKFKIYTWRARMVHDVQTRQRVLLKAMPRIRFKPCDKLNYFVRDKFRIEE